MTMGKYPLRQIAYFVEDVEQAALRHSRLFGSGPFFLVENIQLAVCQYRGQPGRLDHSSAYGQWGELMIEFCQQNNPEPSVFLEHPGGTDSVHHVAIMVEDLPTALEEYARSGHETALYAEITAGQAYAMVDCLSSLGHFVELYEPSEMLTGFYALVRDAAQDWNGEQVIRRLPTP